MKKFYHAEPARITHQREFWVGTDSRIDFVFVDHKKKVHVLVEAQIGQLDSFHSEKLWNRYVPNYRKMRPDVQIRPVLIANSCGNDLLRISEERGVEVKCFSTEELLKVNSSYVMHDNRPESRRLFGSFSGFTSVDFKSIVEADRQHNPELRIVPIGKLYQLRDFLLPKISSQYSGLFLETKVSDKPYPQRLGVPWMGYYFGSMAEGSKNLPHINITLAEESENGLFKKSEGSIHLNAEVKPNFVAVLKALRKNVEIHPLLERLSDKGFELRLYSKIPLRPQSANDNFWTFRKAWPITSRFESLEVTDWFAAFEKDNEKSILEDLNRMLSIPMFRKEDGDYLRKWFRFAGHEKYPKTLSATGRCVFRLGKWWKTEEIEKMGTGFQDVAFKEITELRPFFKFFYQK
jgi:hypothetical protein